jgi:hypothetical protein
MTPYDDLLAMHSARISLLEQLVKLLFRERAHVNGQDSAFIMRYGEQVKLFFEGQMKDPEAEARLVAEVDRFFTALAADVLRDQETQ